jgi:hypothetical protein
MLQHADELSLLQAQIAYKKRMEAVLRELKEQEQSLAEKTTRLKAVMLQEQQDVQRLEKHSLSAFFYQLTGQMDAVMDKERREAYAARAKYDTAMRELDAVREDILETQEDLKDLQDCEERYQSKLTQIRMDLKTAAGPEGMDLLQREQRLSYLTQQEQELQEAIIAGTSALRTMADLKQNLHSAKDWSARESRTPAFWADHARHEQLEEAREHVDRLQIQMQKFNKELSDVTIRPSLQPSIQRMLSFSDFLFDGILSDMAVTERISQSCTLADQTRECILSVLRQLQNTLEEVRHNCKRTQQEMDEIVLHTVNE